MRYLIVSDIHGSLEAANNILNEFNQGYDKLIILGDLYYHGPRNPFPNDYNPMEVSKLLNRIKDKLIVIKGNCDSEVDQMISDFKFYKSKTLKIGNKIVFLTHGHKFNIDKTPPKTKFDIMMYGHFHISFIKTLDGKIFVNPGSTSLPKNGSKKSFAALDEKGIQIKDFSGKVLEDFSF